MLNPISPERISWPGAVLLIITTLAGWVALLYPFALAEVQQDTAQAASAPLLMLALVPLLLGIMLVDLSTNAINVRVLAALGILVALNAVLRLPAGPGDSPTFFFLVILAGYTYGGRFGFLMGAFSLFVSALLIAGFGPWMPYQMLIMGWMGLGTTLIHPLRRLCGMREGSRGEVALLAAYGWLWGMIFGGLMNLTFWPFAAGDTALAWSPGLGLAETSRRYWAFYLLTSLGWDAARALGNVLLIAAFHGRPLLQVLRRFGTRLRWQNVKITPV